MITLSLWLTYNTYKNARKKRNKTTTKKIMCVNYTTHATSYATLKNWVAHCLSKLCILFGAIQKISCRDWWPWTKPGYITMTRRQSNNKWSVGIAAHTAPKNSECKNPLEKFSPRLFGIISASSSMIIFQRAKLSTRSVTHLCWCNWRTFWR